MEKMKFRTQFSVREKYEHHYAPTGEKIEMRHNPYMKENGRRELKKDRAINIYDLIQSHAEECKIENIIRRAVEGDYSILQKRHGQFMDITGCPSSIAEAQQFIINTKEEFEHLPKEIKAKFEYNPEVYIAEMSNNTEGWLEKTGLSAKYKTDKERAEQAVITEQNFQKAMQNLAQGTTVNNEEVKNNE